MNYYIADTHLNHKLMADDFNLSVIDYNDYIIEKWNERVCKNDKIYILGDFMLGKKPYTIEYLNKKLNGCKHLINGNHEIRNGFKMFNFCKDYYELNDDGKHVVLFHYPIEIWNRKQYGSIHLHGHLHKDNHKNILLNDIPNRYCVFNTPKTLNEIINNK